MNNENDNVPEITLRLESGKHKKGQPFPEHDFSFIQKHGITSKGDGIACSNEDVVRHINRAYENKPDAEEVIYFYFQEGNGIHIIQK